MNLEQRVIELETRFAFQETTIQELNEILTSQQQQITHLQGLVKNIQESMLEIVNKLRPEAGTESPPPHY
jgi:SlyX protein